MTPKGKQDYVRHITQRARERNREGGFGIKWKVEKKKKKEGMRYMGIHVCCKKNKRKKEEEGNIWMK